MMTLASLMGIALAFSSPLDNNDSMPRRRLAGYVMTDSNIYTARDAWLANPTAAEATYGHISTWETGGVTDMSYLFCALSAWSSYGCNIAAESFNDDIGAWDTSGVTDMGWMFGYAYAFDQDLGWCVDDDVDLRYAFHGAPCSSTSCGVTQVDGGCAPTPAPTITHAPTYTVAPTASPLVAVDGYGDNGIRTALSLWSWDRAAAIRKYGHISTWQTGGVKDMSYLFAYESSFNDDIGAWDTSSVVDMNRMFLDASAFNQPMGGWRVDKVKDMYGMLSGAVAFDQDLGWCVDKAILSSSTFEGTKCKSTRCGVKREAFGTCDEGAITGYTILIVLLVLLACFGACVCCCQKEDETYFAAARRVLRCCFCCCCCICCRKKKEKSSVNSQPDAGIVPADGCRVPANAPLVGVLKELSSFAFRERDEVRGGAYNKAAAALRMHSVVITSGKEAKKLDGIGKSIAGTIDEFLDKGTVQKLEDYKDRARATVSPRPSVELPPDSPAESPRDEPDEEATAPESLETRAAAKAEAAETVERPGFTRKLSSFLFGEREEAALPVFAEAEGEATEQPPPPPPARRWFSEAEPEPTEPKAEEMHQRMAGWYNDAPEAAALRAAWGEYPGTSDALQAWPGFVQVTNAFLDAKLDEA